MGQAADREAKAFSTAASICFQLLFASMLVFVFYLTYQFMPPMGAFVALAALLALVISINLLIFSVSIVKTRINSWYSWLPWLALGLFVALIELALFGLARFTLIEGLGHLIGYFSY
jgi:hypothetical protein